MPALALYTALTGDATELDHPKTPNAAELEQLTRAYKPVAATK